MRLWLLRRSVQIFFVHHDGLPWTRARGSHYFSSTRFIRQDQFWIWSLIEVILMFFTPESVRTGVIFMLLFRVLCAFVTKIFFLFTILCVDIIFYLAINLLHLIFNYRVDVFWVWFCILVTFPHSRHMIVAALVGQYVLAATYHSVASSSLGLIRHNSFRRNRRDPIPKLLWPASVLSATGLSWCADIMCINIGYSVVKTSIRPTT